MIAALTALMVLCLWGLFVAAAAKPLAGVAVTAFLAASRIPLLYALRLAASDWRLYLLAACALTAAAACRLWEKRLHGIAPGRPCMRWGLLAATVLGAAPAARECRERAAHLAVNRWGFYTPFGLSAGPYVVATGKTSVPDFVVTTNSMGFRDREWALHPRRPVRRVVVAGDSFVWGYGIADPEDMLHRRLQAALDARQPGRWEVVNIANSPAALWYYVNALIAVGREVHPDVYVMSFLSFMDLEPWEVQRVKFGLPPFAVAMMDWSGVSERLMRTGVRVTLDYDRRGRADADTQAEMQGLFARLVEFVEDEGAQLVVWEALGAKFSFREPYRGHPSVRFLGWEDVPGSPAGARPSAGVPWTWTEDPTLSYPGDGHPTPKANGLIAGVLARKILSGGVR